MWQSQASPPFHLNSHPNPGNPDEVTNYIMLVDRGPGACCQTQKKRIHSAVPLNQGAVTNLCRPVAVLSEVLYLTAHYDFAAVGDAETPCKFALKVIHAQEAGAQAVSLSQRPAAGSSCPAAAVRA